MLTLVFCRLGSYPGARVDCELSVCLSNIDNAAWVR